MWDRNVTKSTVRAFEYPVGAFCATSLVNQTVTKKLQSGFVAHIKCFINAQRYCITKRGVIRNNYLGESIKSPSNVGHLRERRLQRWQVCSAMRNTHFWCAFLHVRHNEDNGVLKSLDINTAFLEFIEGSKFKNEHNLCKRSQRWQDDDWEESTHFVFAILQDEQDIMNTYV